MDMTKGNTTKQLITFAFPLIIGNMLQQLYTMTDAMIVGKVLGYQSLAALGSADWLAWFANSIINGLTMGYCAKAAQEKGTNNKERLYSVAAMSIFISIILAIVLLVLGQLLAMPALNLLRTPDDIIEQTYSYLRIIYLALPIALFYNAISALLRAVGDSRTPFVAMLVSSIVNVSLDLLFVKVFQWGIRSAAIATAFAQCCSLIICLCKMLHTPELHFKLSYMKPNPAVIKSILKQSLPPAFQFCLVSLSGLVIQYLTNRQGSLFIAGYTAANKYYGLIEMGAIAIASALLTYTGQNYGAKNLPRIKKGISSGLICAACFSLTVTLTMMIWGKPLLSLFISAGSIRETAEISHYAFQFLMFLSCPLYILYLHHTLRSVLQGLGDFITPVLSGLMQAIFRISSAFLILHYIGPIGVFAAEPCAWFGSVLFLSIRLFILMKRAQKKFEPSHSPIPDSDSKCAV